MSEHRGQSPRRVYDQSAATLHNGDWEKLNAILKDLPPGIPVLPPEDAGSFEKYTHRPAHIYAPDDGWKNCARALEKYDAELCKGYREEIDTLLVFAGLFSAVVTAFTIESYQWLQADTQDAMVALLSQIAQSVSTNNTAAPLVSISTGLPSSVSVRINIYWFLSLALGLSAALVAILCKQWIREFERNTGLSPRELVSIHQTKLEGFEKWRVGDIISLLPLLLQLALAIFALGILELLWQLHSAVAAAVFVPTAIALLFYAGTSLLPALQFLRLKRVVHSSLVETVSDCPYKSPQAMLALRTHDLYSWIRRNLSLARSRLWHLIMLVRLRLATRSRLLPDQSLPPSRPNRASRPRPHDKSWRFVSRVINENLDRVCEKTEVSLPESEYRSLRWIHQNLNDGDIAEWIWRCVWESVVATNIHFLPGSDRLKRNVYHVCWGSTDVPHTGERAMALGYLVSTNAPPMFVVEAFVQNLSAMDAASADYLSEMIMNSELGTDSYAAVSILRAACAYARLHIQEPIGMFLIWVTRIISDCAEDRLHAPFYGATLSLYLNWLRAQPLPYDSKTVSITSSALRIYCTFLPPDPEAYKADPECLRVRPYARELGELLDVYAHMPHSPAWESPNLECSIEKSIFRFHSHVRCLLIRGLLDLSRTEVDGPAVIPGSETVVGPRASASSLAGAHPLAHGLPSGEMPPGHPESQGTLSLAPGRSPDRELAHLPLVKDPAEQPESPGVCAQSTAITQTAAAQDGDGILDGRTSGDGPDITCH